VEIQYVVNVYARYGTNVCGSMGVWFDGTGSV